MKTEETILLIQFSEHVIAYSQSLSLVICIDDSPKTIIIHCETEEIAKALSGLIDGVTEDEMIAVAETSGDQDSDIRIRRHLTRLSKRGFLFYRLNSAGVDVCQFHPTNPDFDMHHDEEELPRHLELSRFAHLRRDGNKFLLESPLTNCQIVLSPLASSLLLTFCHQASDQNEILKLNQGSPWGSKFVHLLWGMGFLEASTQESNDRATWEFHDLMFHWHTRTGKINLPLGGTFRFRAHFPSPPAVKESISKKAISLQRPPLLPLLLNDNSETVTLDAIVERRQSIRDQGSQPITIHEVGLLLYGVGRIKKRIPTPLQELLSRPIPSGGSIHEIEFYLAVHNCAGLAPGMYHYHGEHHALYQLPTHPQSVDQLLYEAACSMDLPSQPPQILLILASRFTRLAWKYQGIAYRLTLLNAGIIFQALYMKATEMNLACTALGTGNSNTFALATGLDPFVETSVAEFALGSRKSDMSS